MSTTRSMWIERKIGELAGPARIGRVYFSKTRRTLYYGGKSYQSLAGRGFKANYFDVATGDEYWISGCRKDGRDALYSTTVEIDADFRDEYWTAVRQMPQSAHLASFCAEGKCG